MSPMAIHVYHPYRQPDGENHCQAVNGHCSHLCLPAPQINARSPRIACACPDGLRLLSDGLMCGEDCKFHIYLFFWFFIYLLFLLFIFNYFFFFFYSYLFFLPGGNINFYSPSINYSIVKLASLVPNHDQCPLLVPC